MDSLFHDPPLEEAELGRVGLSGREIVDVTSQRGDCCFVLRGLLWLRLSGAAHGLEGLGSLGGRLLSFWDLGNPCSLKGRLLLSEWAG